MDIVRFTSPQKPDGKEYKKVVYWNRFIRMKTETIILLLMFVAGIACVLFVKELVLLVAGALFIVFPLIVITQLNSSIRYHLENRDKLESLPCEYTVMPNGILTEIRDEEFSKLYKWEDSTDVYDALGYYMFFNKDTMTVMIDKRAVKADELPTLKKLIRDGMGKKHCRF